MKGQSRIHSSLESITNTIVGTGLAYLLNLYLLPIMLGVSVGAVKAGGISLVYTAVSLVRHYFLRRLFNKMHVARVSKLLEQIEMDNVHGEVKT